MAHIFLMLCDYMRNRIPIVKQYLHNDLDALLARLSIYPFTVKRESKYSYTYKYYVFPYNGKLEFINAQVYTDSQLVYKIYNKNQVFNTVKDIAKYYKRKYVEEKI